MTENDHTNWVQNHEATSGLLVSRLSAQIGMALAGNFAMLRDMKPLKHRSLWVLTPLFLAAAISWAPAEVPSNPYHALAERNSFRLKPAPLLAKTPPPGPEIPLPKVVLTGIVSVF